MGGPSWLLHIIAGGLLAFSASAADSGITVLQSEAQAEAAQRLVGHWRMTRIVFEIPKDEHLGTARGW